MPFLPSLPEPTNLADVIRAFPEGWAEMLAYHDCILRGESPLGIAERELIAAYVSGLNGCRYCLNAHRMYAESFGIGEGVVDRLLDDPDTAPLPDRLRPILAYVRLLTKEPEALTKAHVDAILAAGWPERAVADAARVTALYNFMNRIIIGFGVDPFDDHYARRLAAVRKQPLEKRREANRRAIGSDTYRAYGRSLGIMD
ncbi:MAG: peroxidase [Alphaproteobacteria bacterium]|nr:MAG: peroxidase [Alphaproteobacteria bacterium]